MPTLDGKRTLTIDSVRTVAAGGSLLDPKATAVVLQRLRQGDAPTDPRYESLSPQERRILHLIADGLTNPQIADRLFISRATVKTHLEHIFVKLGFTSRAQVAAWVASRRADHP